MNKEINNLWSLCISFSVIFNNILLISVKEISGFVKIIIGIVTMGISLSYVFLSLNKEKKMEDKNA